jgi:hypothetical protein
MSDAAQPPTTRIYDVTEVVRSCVRGGEVLLEVNNSVMGEDPAPGILKRLRIVHGDDLQRSYFNEYSRVRFRLKNDKLHSAVYGFLPYEVENDASIGPRQVVLLHARNEQLPELRSRGYHTGYIRNSTSGIDCRLLDIFALAAVEPRERTLQRLREWIAHVGSEADQLCDAVVSFWFPQAKPAQIELMAQAAGAGFAEIRAEEILGTLLVRSVHYLGLYHRSPHNASLLRLDPNTLLVVYRSQTFRLASCLIDDRYRPIKQLMSDMGLEWNFDGRLFQFDGTTYMLSAFRGNVVRQELWELAGPRFVPLRRRAFVGVEGLREYSPRCEKNWGPFEHEGIKFVYSIRPHRIVTIGHTIEGDQHGSLVHAELLHQTEWAIPESWKQQWGSEFRGSTPPVRLADGTFLGTWHTPGCGGYYQGFYRFAGRPPFEVLEIGRRPFITPATTTGHNPRSPVRCVFLLSMQVEADLVRVCGGDNDASNVGKRSRIFG